MNRARALRWLLGGALVIALLALALVAWLGTSAGGRDWALARLVSQLPAGSSLQWRAIDGRLSGPLDLRGLDYRQADGLRLRAERLRIDHSVWPLLRARLRIRTLVIEGARIDLPRDEEPFQWPQWPDLLPEIAMPLSLSVQDLQVRAASVWRGPQRLVAIRRASGGLVLGPGELVLRDVLVDSDRAAGRLALDYRPRDNHALVLDARLRLVPAPDPAGRDVATARLHATARGDLDDFKLRIAGTAPEAFSLRLHLRDGRDRPAWQLLARGQRIAPGAFGLRGAEPDYRIDLRAQGRGGAATLDGRLARGTLALGLDGTRLRADRGGLALAPLALTFPQGPVAARGRVDFSAQPPRFDLVVSSPGLRLAGSAPDAAVSTASGEVRLRGDVQRWSLQGRATVARGDEHAELDVAGTGNADSLTLETLQARMPSGSLAGEGRLRWSPPMSADARLRLAGFDPGYFVPDFPGRLEGELSASAAQDPAGTWSGTLQAPDLRGELRGRPLRAKADLAWRDDAGEGELALQLGASRLRVEGRVGARLDLRINAAPLDLADLWPRAGGRIEGELHLRGQRDRPDVQARLQGRQLRWDEHAADRLTLQGRLPNAPARGQLQAQATGLVLAGQAFDQARLDLQGNLRSLQVDGELAGPRGRLAVDLDARDAGADWRGRLLALRVSPERGAPWSLAAPAAWQWRQAGLGFERACLRATDGSGELCARLDEARAEVRGRGLRLALVEPWLTTTATADYESFGSLDLDGDLRRGAQGWDGRVTLASAAGGLRLRAQPATPLLSYSGLRAELVLRKSQWQGQAHADLSGGGRLDASGRGGLAADAPLQGRLELDLRDLTWMELLSPDLAAPSGRIGGTVLVSGTRAAPQIGGDARLGAFKAELPALGVVLREGEVRLVGGADGETQVTGSLRAGEGLLRISGSLDLRDRTQPLLLQLRGEDLLVSDTPELRATVSPQLDLRYLDGELQLRGAVTVPSARVDLEGLDRGVAPSPDVVVLDPREATGRAGLAVDTDVLVRIGQDVRLRGFGLDGRLGGELAVRDRPGSAALANGTLTINGRYQAYGRSLRIRRARLSWVNAGFDNPVLDVLAEHRFEDVTIGVRVRGTALAPETDITSTPAMSTAEALSWLLLGRPLETATGNETARISASALALNAGSSLLAQQLGVRLGLDSAGIVESRSLGGSTLQLGKRLSPRLFVSYGVSLVGTGQVVMLRYMLRRGISLGLESGSVETAGSIDWRVEK